MTAGATRGSFGLAAGLLVRYSPGTRTLITAGLLSLLVGSAVALLQPWPLKLVVDSVVGSVPAPPLLAGFSRLHLLALLGGAMLVIQLIVSAIHVLSTQLLVEAGLRMVFRLRCVVFDHVQRLSLAFHDATAVGDSIYRVAWDTYSVQTLFNEGLAPILNSGITLGGISIILFTKDWRLGLVAMVSAVPLIYLIRVADRFMSERSMDVHARESDVTTRVQETLTGIRAVQAFGREDHESARFRHQADASVRASLRLTLAQTLFQSGVTILLAGGTALVIWIAAHQALTGTLTAGDVVMVAAYVAMFYKPIEVLAYTAAGIQQASAGARRVVALLHAPRDVADRPGARPLPDRIVVKIEFDAVTFAYGNGIPVLRGITLRVSPGQRIALVGPSGAGKSTLLSLLLRFYDAQAGTIAIDGIDVRDVTLASLRKHIALVPQEPILFDATVRENIAYSRPSATAVEIESAARAAGAHEFIMGLGAGYDTSIGERGALLSGGQRQRISLARAFLKDSPILVMDEPTGALDAETEHAVMRALGELARGRTTIIIAHRLSTIRDADMIVVMKEGQIVEVGGHHALLRSGALYPRLYDLQLQPSAASGAGER